MIFFFTLIFVPAAYTRPPSSVTRSAFFSLILVAQSSYELPSTQFKNFKGKLLFCAVSFTYWINWRHLSISTFVAHHLKLIDVAVLIKKKKKRLEPSLNALCFKALTLACVASVSNRVIARKLEREQKKINANFNDSR